MPVAGVIAPARPRISLWRVHYAFFVRASATPAAQQELAAQQGRIIDLARLYADLVA
jgi:hypothetical protein